jgi:hypothetical protein
MMWTSHSRTESVGETLRCSWILLRTGVISQGVSSAPKLTVQVPVLEVSSISICNYTSAVWVQVR